MAKSQEPTPFYIRTRQGETFHVDTLEEALEEFLGGNGYRLTLTAGGKELVIRRDSVWDKNPTLDSKDCMAELTYRERT